MNQQIIFPLGTLFVAGVFVLACGFALGRITKRAKLVVNHTRDARGRFEKALVK